jgi:HAE1 family hydrophobic/amphiphilic exporter-1
VLATIYPGASPSEVENTVTKKIEDAVFFGKHQKIDLSLVRFIYGFHNAKHKSKVDLSLNDAQRKINAIISDLPKDAKAPSLSKFSLSDLPIMTGANGNMDEVAL